MVPFVGADVQLLFDVVQFAVHMLDVGTSRPAIIKLFAAAKLIVQLPGFGTKVLVLAPNVAVGAVTAHLTLHMH